MSTGGRGDGDSYVIVILSLCLSLSLSSLFALLSFCDVYQPPCSMYMLHGLNLYFVRCDILVSFVVYAKYCDFLLLCHPPVSVLVCTMKYP